MNSALFSQRTLLPLERKLLHYAMRELPVGHADQRELTQINCDAIISLFGAHPFTDQQWQIMTNVFAQIERLSAAGRYEVYITSHTRLEEALGKSRGLLNLERTLAYRQRYRDDPAAYLRCRDTLGRIALAWQVTQNVVFCTMATYRARHPLAA